MVGVAVGDGEWRRGGFDGGEGDVRGTEGVGVRGGGEAEGDRGWLMSAAL